MAPTRKSRSVNKKYSYINEVSPNKDGENAKRNNSRVYKYSKHCRVCDKCVDCFDHHYRWLNNCIGKRNYRKFFTLMVSAVLLLIIQWSIGILVLICCFLERKRFSKEITSKLRSSFTMVLFVIVVVVCTELTMIVTLPLAQIFFFHILLVKKGISTYDYIMALREQKLHGAVVQQSPEMSPVSSLTGVSSASSFNTFPRTTWCTPPHLFIEDQVDDSKACNLFAGRQSEIKGVGISTMVPKSWVEYDGNMVHYIQCYYRFSSSTKGSSFDLYHGAIAISFVNNDNGLIKYARDEILT